MGVLVDATRRVAADRLASKSFPVCFSRVVGLTDDEEAATIGPLVVVVVDKPSIVKKSPEEDGVTLRMEEAVCCERTCLDGVLLRSASLRRFFVAPTLEEAVVKVCVGGGGTAGSACRLLDDDTGIYI